MLSAWLQTYCKVHQMKNLLICLTGALTWQTWCAAKPSFAGLSGFVFTCPASDKNDEIKYLSALWPANPRWYLNSWQLSCVKEFESLNTLAVSPSMTPTWRRKNLRSNHFMIVPNSVITKMQLDHFSILSSHSCKGFMWRIYVITV